jgi:hypothetical protein
LKNLLAQKFKLASNKFDKVFIFVLTLIFFPTLFINFDSHHDGLILTTVKLTKNAIIQNGSYPFNQYGPFWAMPYVWIANIVPDDFLFLAIRFLTLVFYFISALLLWKISRTFLNNKNTNIVIILFLCSQPFNTDLGSGLVPWPSALSMMLALMVTFLMLKIIDLNNKNRGENISIYFVGLIIPLILTTRFQVGVLITASVFYIIITAQLSKKIIYLLGGLVTTSACLTLFLINLGWFQDSLFDLFTYGSTYLSGDKSTYPLPIYTILGTIIFIALILIGPKVLNSLILLKSSTKILLLSACLAFMASVFILLMTSRNISVLNTGIYSIRRFWITFSLASLIIATIFVLFSRKFHLLNNTVNSAPLRYKALTLFAISMQSQIFPLFDQMHFWWGSPLVFILVIIIILDRFGSFYSKFSSLFPVKATLFFILILSVFVPFTAMTTKEKFRFPPEVAKYLYVDKPNSIYQEELQNFFNTNIKSRSRVLNLCEDTDIFFQDKKFIPASRFFVYWGKPMSSLTLIENSFITSKPDVIVTCQLLHRPTIRNIEENLQKSLVDKIYIGNRDPIQFDGDKKWTIYLNY